MAYSSGVFSLYSPGNPVVTGTSIASTWANNTLNDIATGLSTCMLKDGTQTITANIPMSSFKLTGLANGSASSDSAAFGQIGTAISLAAIQIGTPQTLTTGTSVDFLSLPTGVKTITVMFSGVTTNNTNSLVVQLGDSGGIEASGYNTTYANYLNAASPTVLNATTGFIASQPATAAAVMHGQIIITLANSSTNTWVGTANGGRTDLANLVTSVGYKSLSATLDRVRFTTSLGSASFSAGEVNIIYE